MKTKRLRKTFSWVLDQLRHSGIPSYKRDSKSPCIREDFYLKDLDILRKDAKDILRDETRRLVRRHEEAILNAGHDAADIEQSFIRLAVQYGECMYLYAEHKAGRELYLRSSTQSACTVSTESPFDSLVEAMESGTDPDDLEPEDLLNAIELGLIPEDYV